VGWVEPRQFLGGFPVVTLRQTLANTKKPFRINDLVASFLPEIIDSDLPTYSNYYLFIL
jgi:hypothetical protein